MESIVKLSVFLASPGDVQAERDTVRRVIDEINKTHGRDKGLMLDVVGWENDTYPSFGGDAQSIVNAQIADMARYDLFVGIMWNRFGKPTPRAESGTEEEFNRAVAEFRQRARPHIMFYFSQKPANLRSREELAQKAKVLEFREQVQRDGLPRDYPGPEEFEKQFRHDITLWLSSRNVETPKPPTQAKAPETPHTIPSPTTSTSAATDPGQWVLLDSRYYEAESVQEQTDGAVEMTIIPAGAEDDASLRSLRPDVPGRGKPVNFAFQNDGFMARVRVAERQTGGGRSWWRVVLQPDQEQTRTSLTEMTYNGVTPDELAVMRARLLLLNEMPPQTVGLGGAFMASAIRGDQGVVNRAVFPDLWREFEGRRHLFLPCARLWAVFVLKASYVCEHVLELTLGPIEGGGKMAVKFRGRRRPSYGKPQGKDVQVEGVCDLSS